MSVSVPVIVASLVLAVLALWRLYSRGRTRSVLLAVAAFFVLFAYGPVINLLLGNDVYFGTDLSRVDTAVAGFALALVGIVVGDQIAPQRQHFDASRIQTGRRLYEPLFLVLVSLIGYGVLVLLATYSDLLGVDKLTAIATAGPGHRIYLLAEMCAVSTYFITRRSALMARLWAVNLGVYVLYCLLTSERDFMLVLFAVLIHREMMNNRARTWKLAAAAGAAVTAASFLFSYRSDEQLDIAGVLNQGSILFVDTFVAGQVPEFLQFQWGRTYLDSFLGLLPSWIVDTGRQTLDVWLVSTYAPGHTSAYGFSLTGEAYVNFGLAGVPVLFLLLTLGHRFVVNRADVNDWWAYFSVYSTVAWMYALRGDSNQLVAALFYGACFFLIIWLCSTRRRTRDEPDQGDRPDPGRRSGAAGRMRSRSGTFTRSAETGPRPPARLGPRAGARSHGRRTAPL